MPSRRGGRSGGSASRENEVLWEGIYDWFCACVPPSAAKIPDYHHPGCPWPRGRFQRGSPCPAALSPFCRSLVPQVLAARYFPCNEHLLPHGPCYSPASLRWRSCGCATCGSLCWISITNTTILDSPIPFNYRLDWAVICTFPFCHVLLLHSVIIISTSRHSRTSLSRLPHDWGEFNPFMLLFFYL